MIVGRYGRAKAGPYRSIRPAEAGAGRYRCPAYKLLDQIVKDHERVRLQKLRAPYQSLLLDRLIANRL